MNTLSVATVVSGLIGTCLKTAVSLDSLRTKFPFADVTITALCSECTLISASLTDIQIFVLQSDFGSRSELHVTFDTVLTACMVGFACLELRLKKLATTPTDHNSNSRTPWRVRAKSDWDEDAMRKYLSHLREGKSALLILVQLLSKKSAEEVKREISVNDTLWENMRVTTRALRNSNPNITVPESLLPSSTEKPPAAIDSPVDTKNILSSTEIPAVDTTSYRRAMAIAQIKATIASPPQSPPPDEDLIDFSEEVSSPALKSPHLSPLEIMWNLDALSPSLPNIIPSTGQPTNTTDNAYHTVRGLSSKNKTNVHRAHRSTSPHTNKDHHELIGVKNAAVSQLADTSSSISSRPSLPLSISPKIIRYTSPCDHEQTECLTFTNTNPFPVTYKISTTRPQSYAVRPNFGTLLPNQRIGVHFILMEVLEVSGDQLKRRDKFRVQSVPVEDVAHGSMFDWKSDRDGARIEELKIKVELVAVDGATVPSKRS